MPPGVPSLASRWNPKVSELCEALLLINVYFLENSIFLALLYLMQMDFGEFTTATLKAYHEEGVGKQG
jgi:hypothetical protein